MIKYLIYIGAGGFVGSVLRFLVSKLINNFAVSSFPFGTLVVNIAGCFLIGLFYGLTEKGLLLNTEWRLFLMVGICGGFTTFSTFAQENIFLLKNSVFLYTALYISISVFLGMLAAYAGNLIIKYMA
jgi:CrcB protein